MKRLIHGSIALCILMFLCSGASASVGNADEDELCDFLDDIDSTHSAKEIGNLATKEHPEWNHDIWKCKTCTKVNDVISFYMDDENTQKGYRRVDFRDGNITKVNLNNYNLIDQYVGKETNTENEGETQTELYEEKCTENGCEVTDSTEDTYKEYKSNKYSLYSNDDNEDDAKDSKDYDTKVSEFKSLYYDSINDNEASDEDSSSETSRKTIADGTKKTLKDLYTNDENDEDEIKINRKSPTIHFPIPDEDPDEMTTDDKIESIVKYYNTGDLSASAFEEALYFYFGDE